MHQACDICGAPEPKRTRPRRSGSRLCKTKKKWIDGSRLQDQVDRWIKIQETKTQEAISIPMPRLGTPKVSSSNYGSRPKKQCLYRCPGWGRWRSLQVTKDHNTTTTGISFHPCVAILYVKNILFNLHTVFSLYTGTLPIHLSTLFCLIRWVFFLYLFLLSALFFLFFVNFFEQFIYYFSSLTGVFLWLVAAFVLLTCLPFLQPGLASHPKIFFYFLFCGG